MTEGWTEFGQARKTFKKGINNETKSYNRFSLGYFN